MSRSLLAIVAVVAFLAAPVQASNVEATRSAPLHVDAAAWYLVGSDGAVLAQSDARARRAPASITKLMTAIVTLEHARPSDVVRVSPRAARIGESTVYLRPNELLSVGELIHGMLIRSGNDAAEALALYVGHGSEGRFVSLMNAEARELGSHRHDVREPAWARPGGSPVERARYDAPRPVCARDPVHPRHVAAELGLDPGERRLPDDRRPARELAAARRRQDRATRPTPAGTRRRPRARTGRRSTARCSGAATVPSETTRSGRCSRTASPSTDA